MQTQEQMHVQMTMPTVEIGRCTHRQPPFRSRTPGATRPEPGLSWPSKETSMNQPHNGIPTTELPPIAWQKSRRSNPSGNCVELAELPGGAGIAVRNSRDPEGPALIYTVAEITAFILGARDGDFDHLIV